MPEPKKPILRSLGEFFGHIVQGIRTDPAAPQSQVVGRKVEEQPVDDPEGLGRRVVLRRTTIEEVEIHPPASAAPENRAP